MPPVTDTRQRLIDAAGELFWERGYAATGLSDILEAAGARGGSLYHFFPTKDDLLLAVIERQTRVIESTIENTLAASEGPTEKILAVVEFYRRFMKRTGCTLGCPMTNLAGEIGDTHPAAAALLAGFSQRLTDRIAENLGQIYQEQAATQINGTARAIVCMIQGALTQARASKSEGPLDDCAAMVRGMLAGADGSPVVVRRAAVARS